MKSLATRQFSFRSPFSLPAVAVVVVLASSGCGKKSNDAPSTTAALAPAAAPTAPAVSAAPASAPKATATAHPSAVSPAAVPTQAAKKKAGGKSKAHELSIWDTSAPNEGITTCGDRDIVVVLPVFLDSDDWKVKVDRGLAAPKREVRKAWRGANSDSEAFRWSGLDTPAGQYVVTFTSGSEKVKVDIKIDPRMECEN
jgi:hypothetical protein